MLVDGEYDSLQQVRSKGDVQGLQLIGDRLYVAHHGEYLDTTADAFPPEAIVSQDPDVLDPYKFHSYIVDFDSGVLIRDQAWRITGPFGTWGVAAAPDSVWVAGQFSLAGTDSTPVEGLVRFAAESPMVEPPEPEPVISPRAAGVAALVLLVAIVVFMAVLVEHLPVAVWRENLRNSGSMGALLRLDGRGCEVVARWACEPPFFTTGQLATTDDAAGHVHENRGDAHTAVGYQPRNQSGRGCHSFAAAGVSGSINTGVYPANAGVCDCGQWYCRGFWHRDRCRCGTVCCVIDIGSGTLEASSSCQSGP